MEKNYVVSVKTKLYKIIEKVWLYLYESAYSNETLRAYFDEEWFDDDYIESEKRKKNEVAYSPKSKFQPFRYDSMPKGKVPMREFIGKGIPMDSKECPKDLKCKKD